MKVFAVCLAFAAVISISSADLSDEQKQKVIDYAKECIGQSGVAPEVVAKARKGDFADDPKLAKFTFCMSKKVGFQSEAGDIQKDVIKQKLSGVLDAAAADKIIDKCLGSKKETPEATAIEVFKCYYANTPAHLSIA